jgi:hypothetical protein
VIELKDPLGDLADLRQWRDPNTLKPKVIGPLVGARIEESANAAGSSNRANVTPFVTIAVQTRISQIFGGCRSAVLFANDMIDLASEIGNLFVNEAVFTKPVGSARDEAAQLRANIRATHSSRFLRRELSPDA